MTPEITGIACMTVSLGLRRVLSAAPAPWPGWPDENITPVVRRDVVARYGTRMLTLINAVSAWLTTGSLRSLDAQVVLAGRRPRSAAEAWLRAQGLMQTVGVVH